MLCESFPVSSFSDHLVAAGSFSVWRNDQYANGAPDEFQQQIVTGSASSAPQRLFLQMSMGDIAPTVPVGKNRPEFVERGKAAFA